MLLSIFLITCKWRPRQLLTSEYRFFLRNLKAWIRFSDNCPIYFCMTFPYRYILRLKNIPKIIGFTHNVWFTYMKISVIKFHMVLRYSVIRINTYNNVILNKCLLFIFKQDIYNYKEHFLLCSSSSIKEKVIINKNN